MKKFKLTRKSIIIAVIIVLVLAVVVYNLFIKNNGEEIVSEKVVYGAVIKEVSETGTVKASEEADLSFKYAGRVEKIYVEVGDVVGTGQMLAKQDTRELAIQLEDAKADLKLAQAKEGDAQVSLKNAVRSLDDVKVDAEEDLKNAYEDALAVLDDSDLKIYNALNVVDEIKRDYFTSNDQEAVTVSQERNAMKKSFDDLVPYIDTAEQGSRSDIDAALSEAKKALARSKDALEEIRNITENVSYRDTVSSTDKTSLDNHKSYINDVYTDIIDAIQTISTTKITNSTNINSAQAEIDLLESQLKQGGLYQAQISQAEADIALLENKINEAYLRSPANGQVTGIDKTRGETVQAAEVVISFLPSAPFKVEVDIYEEDIVDVKVGDRVRIDLVAFPDDTLMGNVVSVDPAEKLIDSVVYYQVDIDFEEVRKGMKIGMTADIIIETDKKENVLIIPEEAVETIEGKSMVKVIRGSEVEEREVEIGLEGDDYVEVVSGLEEGEEVVMQ